MTSNFLEDADKVSETIDDKHTILPDVISNTKRQPSICLTSLPDEVISMCYSGLSANDLVSLEYVSYSLHSLISSDGYCWKKCVKNEWKNAKFCSNSLTVQNGAYENENYDNVLQRAVKYAGSWKSLYAQRLQCYKQKPPWLVACPSEINAMVDIMLSIDTPVTEILHNSSTQNHEEKHSETNGSNSYSNLEPSSPPRLYAGHMLENSSTTTSPISIMKTNEDSEEDSISVIVLIDASSSVTEDDFKSMKSITRSIVDGLRYKVVRKEGYISVIQFNQRPRLELPLTSVSKPKVLATIDGMSQLMGSTDIAAPLRKAKEVFMEDIEKRGNNMVSKKHERIIVLITDGQTHRDELKQSEREAQIAHDELGASIYTIGVGRDVDEKGLNRISSASKGGMYFGLRRYVHSN